MICSDKRIPTEKDISPTNGLNLDEKCALEHFLGLDRQSAIQMLRDNAESLHVYLGDYVFMGRSAYDYYLPVLFQYLDELSDEDYIDYAPNSIDYILIRFFTDDAIPQAIIDYILAMDKRLKHIPDNNHPPIPQRITNILSKYT